MHKAQQYSNLKSHLCGSPKWEVVTCSIPSSIPSGDTDSLCFIRLRKHV